MYDYKNEILFDFGESDICIKKEKNKNECYCEQDAFDYQGNDNVFVGKEGSGNPFTVKRIQVWQMYETEEQKSRREEQERQEEIEKQMKKKETPTNNNPKYLSELHS